MTVKIGFVVSGPISDQILSISHLMVPVWWKKCSSGMLSLLKYHEMIFSGSLFWSTLKVKKNIFAQDLCGITHCFFRL